MGTEHEDSARSGDEYTPKLEFPSTLPVPVHATSLTIYSGSDGFLLTFTAMLPKLSAGAETPRVLEVKPLALLHLNPKTYFQAIEVYIDTWNKYRDEFDSKAPRLKLAVERASVENEAQR